MSKPRLLDLFCGAGGAAMGMDWGDWEGVKLAIPPAYTEFIGAQLLESLQQKEAR